MLTDRVCLASTFPSETPEDILSNSLGVLFPDDINHLHGDPATPVVYSSPKYGDIKLTLADPQGEENRKLFSHYLWNSSLLMAILLEEYSTGPPLTTIPATDTNSGAPHRQEDSSKEEPEDPRKNRTEDKDEITKANRKIFDVRDHTVLELGAGTGLAGIIATKAGAKQVHITDYPAEEILANIRANVEKSLTEDETTRCTIAGHEWGILPSSTPSRGTDPDSTSSESTKDTPQPDCRSAPTAPPAYTSPVAPDPDANSSVPLLPQPSSITLLLAADTLWLPSTHAAQHCSMAHFLHPRAGRALVIAGFHTGRARLAAFLEPDALRRAGLAIERVWERDVEGGERAWVADRGLEDVTGLKRWLLLAVLRMVVRDERGKGDGERKGGSGEEVGEDTPRGRIMVNMA